MNRSGRWIAWAIAATSISLGIISVSYLLRDNQVQTLRLATGSSSGEYYAFGQAIAQVTANHYPKLKIEVVESSGSGKNMADVSSGAVELAMVQGDTPTQANVQAIASLYPEMYHFIASAASGISSPSEIKGKRIALMPEGSGSYSLFWPLINHYGLSEADFTALPMPPAAAHTALEAGQVDALFRVIGLGNSSVSELLNGGKARLLPIPQIGALQLSQPYLERVTIPQGAYRGSLPIPPEDLPVVSVSALLVANQSVETEAVKAISKVLYEHRNELIAINPRTARIQHPDTNRNLGFPMHSGAIAFHNRDQPSFLVQYSEPIGLLVSVGVLLASSLWQLRQWLLNRQKDRADMYNLEILKLIEDVNQATQLQELNRLQSKLMQIFKQVVVDLDEDRISPESFQSFTFPFEVAISSVRHQELMLSNRTVTATSI
ncbi:MAG: TAXI family TRAP transporter solute-binding subunit [Synechococcales cyanobacterium RM1_1_8]|nr:TAXI family TRAP transporter solute-binding subunit [Synechococcales cyanobacterium RM1_1_8]